MFSLSLRNLGAPNTVVATEAGSAHVHHAVLYIWAIPCCVHKRTSLVAEQGGKSGLTGRGCNRLKRRECSSHIDGRMKKDLVIDQFIKEADFVYIYILTSG